MTTRTASVPAEHPGAGVQSSAVDCCGPRLHGLFGDSWCGPSATAQLAARLDRLGLRPGVRVLVSDESTPALALVLATLMTMNVSIVLLDRGLPPAAVADIARRTGSGAVVGPHLLDAQDGAAPPHVLGTADSLVVGVTGRCAGRCSGDDDRAARLAAWRTREDALLMWTSGSSGPPKGLVKSGAAVVSNVEATVAALAYREDDVLLPLLPLTHQYGMSLVIIWWLVGCDLVLGNHRRPLSTIRQARALRPTVVDAVPPVYQSLLGVLATEGVRALAPSVRLWCVGGSPLSPLLAARFRELTGQPLLDGYGSTEAGNVALATLDDDRDLGRPLPGIEVDVRTSAGGTCAIGEPGEIWLRSPYLFSRYLDSDVTAPNPRSWFPTGDVGTLDELGRLQVLGRAHAVHRGGFTLYPASIERAAASAGISLLMVVLPDDRMGSHLTAVIEDVSVRSAATWSDLLRQELADYEQPNRILVVEAFPRLSNGKADLARLISLAQQSRSSARSAGVAARPPHPLPSVQESRDDDLHRDPSNQQVAE